MTISRSQMNRQLYYGGGEGIASLDAGAPSIKYEGDIKPQIASAPDPMADLYDQFLNMKKQGVIPANMDFDSFKDLIREQAAYGGSMRQQYGLGSIVKKAVKGVTGAVKDIAKSDLGKAALGAAALYYAPALLSRGALSPGLAGWQSGLGFAGNLAKEKFAGLGLSKILPETALGRTAAVAAIGGLTGFLSSQGMSEEEIEQVKSNPEALKIYLRQYYTNLNPELKNRPEQVESFVQSQLGEYSYATGGRVNYNQGSSPLIEQAKILAERNGTTVSEELGKLLEYNFESDVVGPENTVKKAYGGRMMKAYGDTAEMASGIASLPLRQNEQGVKEVDLRETGGFIPPVGIKEKEDDIPAMLSNNEFVFTADAVRGMGNGDVNVGAQRMYDMMKKLENGGRV